MLHVDFVGDGRALVVVGYPDRSDYLIDLRRQIGDRREFGLLGDRYVWRIGERGLRVWDARTREALFADFAAAGAAAAVGGRDGRSLHLLIVDDAARRSSLKQFDLATGRVVRVLRDLPYAGGDDIAARPDGRLVYRHRADDARFDGLALIDPVSGAFEVELCDDGAAMGEGLKFRRPSPDGRIWLRHDGGVLPEKRVQIGGAEVTLYGVTVQVWEAFPLRFVKRLCVGWLPAETIMVNAGDVGLVATISAAGAAADAGPLGLPGRDAFPASIVADDALWGSLRARREAMHRLSSQVAWQPDGEAFWTRLPFWLSCVGLDGSLSPRLTSERVGGNGVLGRGAPLALPGRRALAHVTVANSREEGDMAFDGAPSSEPYGVTTTPRIGDQFRSDRKFEAALAELRSKRGFVSIDLPDLSAASVAAALDTLTELVAGDFDEHAHGETIEVVFRTPAKSYREDAFFAMVARRHPQAAPALRRLIDAFSADGRNRDLRWDNMTASLGHAALALAKLDPHAGPTLRRYGAQIDGEHECFYTPTILPTFFKTHGWSDEAITLSIGEMLNNGSPEFLDMDTIWRRWGMGKAVRRAMTPEAFAARVADVARESTYPDIALADFRSGFRRPEGWLAALLPNDERWLATFFEALQRALPDIKI